MVRIEIVKSLFEEIEKTFKKDSDKIFDLIESVKDNSNKGKLVGNVGGMVIKELKYQKFRFYFITDGFKLKFLDANELNDLLIRFVRMSDKKSQQKVINEIKNVLIKTGSASFE
jgi:hypothetical protein